MFFDKTINNDNIFYNWNFVDVVGQLYKKKLTKSYFSNPTKHSSSFGATYLCYKAPGDLQVKSRIQLSD